MTLTEDIAQAFAKRKAVLQHLRDDQAQRGAGRNTQAMTASRLDELTTLEAAVTQALRRAGLAA